MGANFTASGKEYYLGTAGEFRFRALGKYLDTNLLWKETWCVDTQKNSLRNNENGLYVTKVFVSSGGAGPVVLVNSVEEGVWKFEKVNGKNDVYNIVMAYPLRGYTYALSHGMKDSENTYVGYSLFNSNDSYQQWKIV